MGRRVLVVDDEREILDLVSIWLEDDPRCGPVATVTTLDAAVANARSSCPDVILLDFRVAGDTSASIIRQLREACPEARIVIHTASRDEAEAADVLALGADAIVEKATVSIPDVVEAVLA